MWNLYWLALGVFATMMTLLWLVVQPEKRVYFTAGMGGIAWATMALTARGVQRINDAGEIVDTPVSQALQLFVALLAFLSLTVVVLYRLGEYPPPEEETVRP